MAAAPDPTNTSAECGYCLKQNENMKKPKLLPCGHIHCSGCLDGALDARKIVECPDCEQVLNVPIHSLPDAQIGAQNPQYFCDVCEKPATIYCPEAECKKKYCPEHKKHHDALLSKHKFISITEFSLRSKQEEKRTCSVHEGQVLSFGCRRCSDILCEECIDEEGACSGSWHRPVHLRKLHGEISEKIELLKTKVEERKDVLLFLSKESDRVLTEYGEETEQMVKLMHNTRDDQLKEINAQYESLEKKFNENRQKMEGNIVHFKNDVVESELSHLNAILQRMLASLKQDHLVDVIRNGKQAERELNNGLSKELPALRITEATGLTIKESSLAINAEITKIMYDILIGQLSESEPDFEIRKQSEVPEKEGKSILMMQPMADSESIEDEEETMVKRSNRNRRQVEVKEEFDRIHYDFLKIIHVNELTSKILEKFGGTLTESEHPDNDQLIVVTVKSYIPGEAERMMDALVELFNDVTKSVYSHSIKLNYDGDKQELAKALVDQLRDPRYGFIARLSSNDEIRIIGSPANKDKNVQLLERYISYYKKKKPAHHVMQKKQLELTLPNGTVISIMQGDLTKMKTDAVVSSSGTDLAHKRGVSKAIAEACGQRFQIKGKEFLRTGGSLKEGDTLVQPADGELAKLGVRCVIHAIAPLPKKGADVRPLLVKTIREALREAEGLKFKTIAFPAICAGVMGVPIATCGLCYWVALAMFSSKHPVPYLKQICFVVDDYGLMQELYNVMADMSVKGKAGSPDFHILWEQTENLYAADHTAVSARGRGRPADRRNSQPVTGMQDYYDTSYAGMAYNLAKNAFTNFSPGMPADLGLSPEHAAHWPKLEAASPPYSDDTQDAAATGNRVTTGVRGAYGGAAYKDKPVMAGVHEDPLLKPTLGTNPAASFAGTSKPNENECPICLEELKDVKALPCSHKFCKNCISQLVTTTKSNQCPTCRYPFRNAEGKQPKGGRMTTYISPVALPGYERYKTIVISYDIPGGRQGPEHPQPGAPYQGAHRRGYLPDNTKGKQAERLLKKAFDQRLVFTVGHSITTGRDSCVTWNDIHHKTNMTGGPSNYGYPDPDYLDRLIEDLSAKGICE